MPHVLRWRLIFKHVWAGLWANIFFCFMNTFWYFFQTSSKKKFPMIYFEYFKFYYFLILQKYLLKYMISFFSIKNTKHVWMWQGQKRREVFVVIQFFCDSQMFLPFTQNNIFFLHCRCRFLYVGWFSSVSHQAIAFIFHIDFSWLFNTSTRSWFVLAE